MARAPLTEPEYVGTFVLYDPADGRIVHIHRTVVLPGGRMPDNVEIENHARDRLSTAHGRRHKKHLVDVSRLEGLHHPGDDLQPHRKYKVDVARGRLIENGA